MITRYVNTNSTAGGNGTTNATSGANRAFATLAEGLDTISNINNPQPLSDAYTFYCEGSAADTAPCDQGSWGFETSASNYVLITTTAQNRHNGKWDATKYRREIVNGDSFYCHHASHIRIDGIQSKITTSGGGGNGALTCYRLATAANLVACDHRISNCIAWCVDSGGGDVLTGFTNSGGMPTGGTLRIWNCIAYGANASGAGFETDNSAWAGSSVFTYNCTSYNNGLNYANAQRCYNCLSASHKTLAFVNISVGSHNASTSSSVPGTNGRTNQTFSFVDAANGDFHLTSTDAGARNFGVSDPGSGLFGDDIDGQTRSGSWDIGADEYAVAASLPILRLRKRLEPASAAVFGLAWWRYRRCLEKGRHGRCD